MRRPALVRVVCLLASLAIASTATETLVCLGDSITCGYGLDEKDAYPRRLADLIRRDGLDWRVVTVARSDQTIDAARRRLDEVLAARPRLAFIALGTSDGLIARPPATIARGIVDICDRLSRARVRVALAGADVPLRYGDAYRDAFTAVFPAVAATRRLPLMPFMLAGVEGDPTLNQADGLHPTAEGQRRIAERVYAFLKPMLDRCR